MLYESTIVSVLSLLSVHSDVVNAAPPDWSQHQTREKLGGRNGASLQERDDMLLPTGNDQAAAYTPRDVDQPDSLYVRQGDWPPPPKSLPLIPTWVRDVLLRGGAETAAALAGVYRAGKQIRVVTRGKNTWSEMLNRVGTGQEDLERQLQSVNTGLTLVNVVSNSDTLVNEDEGHSDLGSDDTLVNGDDDTLYNPDTEGDS